MTAAELPVWVAVLVAVLVVVGAGATLLGTIGLVRFRSFYERVHAPTLGTSGGTGCVVLASVVMFSFMGTRPVFNDLLIFVFLTVTTPVTLMLLARAALYRDRSERNPGVPPAPAPSGIVPPTPDSSEIAQE